MLYFEHKGCYRAGNLWEDIFLVVPSPGGNKNLAALASFDFRILWRHVKTSNTGFALWYFSVPSEICLNTMGDSRNKLSSAEGFGALEEMHVGLYNRKSTTAYATLMRVSGQTSANFDLSSSHWFNSRFDDKLFKSARESHSFFFKNNLLSQERQALEIIINK